MENFIFCAVSVAEFIAVQKKAGDCYDYYKQ